MKKFDIEVELNGKITFEVPARNKKEAQAKVDELLQNTSLKEAIEKYQDTMNFKMNIKQEKSLER